MNVLLVLIVVAPSVNPDKSANDQLALTEQFAAQVAFINSTPPKQQFRSLSPASRELHLCHVITDARQERSVGKPLGRFSDLVERSIDIALGNDSAADTRQLIGDDMAKFCGIHTSTVSDNGGRRGSAARNSEP